jgi:hypothetical protein
MRAIIAAVLAMTASVAIADDIDDVHRQALAGRDSYWNCLARESMRDSNRSLSGTDFTLHIAGACPSERQSFRVALVGYLTMQFPSVDAGVHMTTANNAIGFSLQRFSTFAPLSVPDLARAFIACRARTIVVLSQIVEQSRTAA